VTKTEPCAFGNKCLKLHLVGADEGRRPFNITTTFPGATSGTSPGHTPGHTPNTAREHYLKVNKPGGCDEANCSLSHVLKGVPCRNGEYCTWGINCAYVHPERNATTSLIDKYTDLKPLLDEALEDYKGFKVRLYINKPPVYCLGGENCEYNHTLEGVECPDHNNGGCTQERCPLVHKRRQAFNQQQRSVTPQAGSSDRSMTAVLISCNRSARD
jgi:hypothetical protein